MNDRLARTSAIPIAIVGALLTAGAARAQDHKESCPVSHDQLAQVLKQSVKASGGPDNGGLPVNEWAAVVNRKGVVCAVAFSGDKPTDQWPGSRAIAVEKANTVNAFGLDKFAISTANLWAQSQPGGFMFGAAMTNPPVARELYAGNPDQYGSASDPLVGKSPGGVVAFGGGLGLYDQKGIVGGLGASGNTSCADHNIAWRIRQKLKLDNVPNGPTPQGNDAIVYDVGDNGVSRSGWGHPGCGHNARQVAAHIGAGIVMSAANPAPLNQPGTPSTQGAASPSQQEKQHK